MIQSPLKGVMLALLAFGIYSSHDAAIKYLGTQMAVLQIILFANLFAIVPMNVMMLADRKTGGLRPRRPWLVMLRTLMSLISTICGFYAFTTLPLAEVYALLFVMPLIITLLAVPLLGERLGPYRISAVVFGLIGVLIVLRPGASELSLGHGAALVGATASAMTAIIMRKIGNQESTAVMVLYPILAMILLSGAAMPWVYTPVAGQDLALLMLIGLLVMLAHLSMLAAYRHAAAGLIAPIQYTQIIWATFYGAMFFGEVPDRWVAVGTGVIIVSGLVVVLRETRRKVSRTMPVTSVLNPRADKGPSLRVGGDV